MVWGPLAGELVAVVVAFSVMVKEPSQGSKG
jgi:hypothetical protein